MIGVKEWFLRAAFELRDFGPGTQVAKPRARRAWSAGVTKAGTHGHEESICAVGDRTDRRLRVCSAESHSTIRSTPTWQTGQRCLSMEGFGS